MWLIIRQIINFPVAVFIFLSGYFVKIDEYKESFTSAIKKRVYRLFIPFMVWSTFYTFTSMLIQVRRNEELDFLRIFLRFIVGKSAAPLYYILVLLQLIIITPLLIKIIEDRNIFSKLLWLVTPIYLLFIYVFNFIEGTMPLLYETLFPAWFVFYYLGLNLRIKNLSIISLAKKTGRFWVVLFVLGLSLLEAFSIINLGMSPGFASSQIKFSSFLYAFVLSLFLFNISRREINDINTPFRIIKCFGDYSYGIYYIHVFILMFVPRMLSIIGLNKIWGAYFLSSWFLTAILSLLILKLSHKILGDKSKIIRILGLK